ncbi:hypothetical protein SK3146_05194 [Paenibacillus konkukensis]|uniref:Uncharacterized protein n=1 Tax=Paenibacillus konkukensis TaxID=2020716 RepID=A0ABY4RWY0_9BACL|nr:hypothetical protein SK3146_05194 [Paenibacillus konkukensis]
MFIFCRLMLSLTKQFVNHLAILVLLVILVAEDGYIIVEDMS